MEALVNALVGVVVGKVAGEVFTEEPQVIPKPKDETGREKDSAWYAEQAGSVSDKFRERAASNPYAGMSVSSGLEDPRKGLDDPRKALRGAGSGMAQAAGSLGIMGALR